MREVVHERLAAVGFQARADAAQQLLPVAHVLEELDRDDPVDGPAGVVVVGVGGDDLDVGHAARPLRPRCACAAGELETPVIRACG